MKNWVRVGSVIAVVGFTLIAAQFTPLTEFPIWLGCGVAILSGARHGTKTL